MGAVGGAGFQPRRKGTKELLGFSPWGRKPQRLKPTIAGREYVRAKALTRQSQAVGTNDLRDIPRVLAAQTIMTTGLRTEATFTRSLPHLKIVDIMF